MLDLIIYLIMAAIGWFVGSRYRERKELLKWTGKVQTAAIVVLVFSMGARMGSNEEVTGNLGSIGLYALLSAALVIAFSVAAVSVARRLMGIDKTGERAGGRDTDVSGALKASTGGTGSGETSGSKADTGKDSESGKDSRVNKMTIFIVIAVACGMLYGYLFAVRMFGTYERFNSFASLMIHVGLCVLLFFVGTDLGLDGTIIANFKRVGARVFVIPLAIVIGTFAGMLVCRLFIPLSLKELMAIGAGFGWYSLAPGIIMDAGYVQASAVSFLHNVLREMLSILFIPLVARRVGYVETVAMPGAAAMDVCLPIVERSTSGGTAVYSFISGVILSALVPVLVPLIIG